MADDDKVTKEDRALADAAREKAGGVVKLAKAMRSSKQAASVWGRLEPIPKHLRPRLEEYVFGPPKPQRLTPTQMRALFERWVREVGPDVVDYDLWAGMEAGFNNGIARELARRTPAAGPVEEPPASDAQRQA